MIHSDKTLNKSRADAKHRFTLTQENIDKIFRKIASDSWFLPRRQKTKANIYSPSDCTDGAGANARFWLHWKPLGVSSTATYGYCRFIFISWWINVPLVPTQLSPETRFLLNNSNNEMLLLMAIDFSAKRSSSPKNRRYPLGYSVYYRWVCILFGLWDTRTSRSFTFDLNSLWVAQSPCVLFTDCCQNKSPTLTQAISDGLVPPWGKGSTWEMLPFTTQSPVWKLREFNNLKGISSSDWY